MCVKNHKAQSKLSLLISDMSLWPRWHVCVSILLYSTNRSSFLCIDMFADVFFFKLKARSKGTIYSIKNQSVFYFPWQLMSSQINLFLILSVTIFTDCFSLINDEDRCDWCCQCLWTKVDVLAADFNVWLLYFYFFLLERYQWFLLKNYRQIFLMRHGWFWGKGSFFIQKYNLIFQLSQLFNCSVFYMFFPVPTKQFVWCRMGFNGAFWWYSISEWSCQFVLLDYFNVPIFNLQWLVCIFMPFKNGYYKHGK